MQKKNIILILILILLSATVIGVIFITHIPTNQPSDSPVPNQPSDSPVPNQSYQLLLDTDYSWDSASMYETAIRSLGYTEIFITQNAGDALATIQCIPNNLTITETQFELQFSYQTWDDMTKEYSLTPGWLLIGTKAEACENISSLLPQNFDNSAEEYSQEDIREIKTYWFVNNATENMSPQISVCYAVYYPNTNHLFNLVKTFDEADINNMVIPDILVSSELEQEYTTTTNSTFVYENGNILEYAEFVIRTNEQEETYKYRVGMTLDVWGNSIFTNNNWHTGFDGYIYSNDYQYVVAGIDGDLRLLLDEDDTLTASTSDSYMQGTINTQSLFQSALMPTTIAHLIDTTTPLPLNGIKIDNNYVVTPGYTTFNHAFIFDSSETISVSLRNIETEWLQDMALYVFKEPLELRDLWEYDSLLGHRVPTQDISLLQIPDDARAIPFTRYESEIKAPSDEYYLYSDEKVAIATFTINQEPNYSSLNSNVFAITYKNHIVYWVHVPIYSENTNIFDFSKIEIIFLPDKTFVLQSDFYTSEQLEQARKMLEDDPTWYENMLAKLEETDSSAETEYIEGKYPDFIGEP